MAIITLNNNSLSDVTSLPAGVGGKVLQVVSNTYTSDLSTTSTSNVATGYTVTITPSSTSNKIMIFVTGGNTDYDNGTPQVRTEFYANVGGAGYNSISSRIESLAIPNMYTSTHSMSLLYSPSTTSSIIIQPFFHSSDGNSVYFNRSFSTVTVTAMEVSG